MRCASRLQPKQHKLPPHKEPQNSRLPQHGKLRLNKKLQRSKKPQQNEKQPLQHPLLWKR